MVKRRSKIKPANGIRETGRNSADLSNVRKVSHPVRTICTTVQIDWPVRLSATLSYLYWPKLRKICLNGISEDIHIFNWITATEIWSIIIREMSLIGKPAADGQGCEKAAKGKKKL